MIDYKDTLNLPHTDFPMKANLPQREPEILQKWADINIYGKMRAQGKDRPKFILHDGPPYANGHTHIGHAINKTLKDIVVKAKTLSGFDAPYIPGWDCHGLPIELNVEKKLGKAGDKLSAKEFRDACRTYAREQIDIQRREFSRLGGIGDWAHPYLTMNPVYEANIIRALAKIIENGHLQQGFKPVHWCIDCGSALAEAEVEYANKTSPAIDVQFRVVDENDFLERIGLKNNVGEGPISVPIWTTTPWTLPANEAVALHADSEYVLIQTTTERLFISSTLLASCLERYSISDYRILKQCNGNVLERAWLQHPFYDRKVPIVLGEHVTMDAGTGAVHTAPAHGQDDYQVGVKYQLPLLNPVGKNGCFLPETPLFAGLHVLKANARVIEVLKERNALLCEKKLEHSYPHCWRHKTPLIFLATPQWFISMEQEGLRAKALDEIKKAQWLPDWGQARITAMIAGRPDWCISRQRTWGTPMALFVHKTTGKLHPDTISLLEKIAQRVEIDGIEAWHALDTKELLGADAEHYEKTIDTLDVWFDSGVSHFAVLQKNPVLSWPADLYLEGSDQHRGWFHSSLLTSCAIYGKAPYKAVLTHGFTVDEQGRKMSKSIGNVLSSEKAVATLGADILRLWIASADYRAEITFSDEIFKRIAEGYRRIRNTIRFLLANLHDFNLVENHIAPEQMLSLDQWVLAKTAALQQEIIKAYDDYQFHLVYQKIHNFCVNELGGLYLDIIKDRQYTMKKDSIGRRSAQSTLYHVAEAMVRWFAPILSFTAEEIWHYLPTRNNESVFLNTWYKIPVIKKEEQQWEHLVQIRNAVNKEIESYRNNGQIGSALEAEIEIYCEPNSTTDKNLHALDNELRFFFITSDARVLPANASQKEDYVIKVIPIGNTKQKCARCWHRRADVGQHPEHLEICGRCIENINGKGEERRYA